MLATNRSQRPLLLGQAKVSLLAEAGPFRGDVEYRHMRKVDV